MIKTETPTLRIAGPTELCAGIPYMIGFHPRESLVIVGLADQRLVVTARIDLDHIEADARCLADAIGAIARGGTRQLVGAVYTDTGPGEEAPLPHTVAATALASEATRASLELIDCLLVAGGRWWSYSCPDAECCPADGAPLPTEPTALHAAATYAGLSVLPDRQALANTFTPIVNQTNLASEIRAQEIKLSANDADDHTLGVRSVIRALFASHRAAQAGRMPPDCDAARYGIALRSDVVRDAIWMALDDGRLRGLDLWVNLARRLPTPYKAAPLFLAGWRAYRDGNGALAAIAAERALASDTDYSAAKLLLAALARGIDPRTLPRLRPPRTEHLPATTA